MNKKDIEARFEIQDNRINFLTEGHHELWKKLKSLEFKTDRIEERLKNQESIKLDTDLHINAYEFSKNRCPRCGSHNLHYAFSRYGLDDSEVYCKDCNNHWKFGHSDVAPKNPYEENEELKDVNKKLGNEIDELVHKYDTMNRRYLDAYNNYRDVQDKLDVIREANKTIKENAAKLMKEKDELIKVLNIYQAITDIDYDFETDTAMVRLNGADGAGRSFIHDGDAARALYSAYVKYHDNSFKYKPGEKPDYKMSKKEKDELTDVDMFASACYAMASLAKNADALAIHLQKRQVYLANPKTLKVPVEFMLEDARYNFPFLREKRVWALDTCRTNVIRIVVMFDKAYCYDFNKQSLTPIDALMED